MAEPLVVDGPDRVAAALSGLSVALMAVPAAGGGDPRMFGPVDWWWPMLFAAALASLHAQIPWRRRSRGAAAVVVAFWSAAGSWVAWGYANGLGHGGYWLTWAAGLVLTMVAAATWATPTDLGLPMRPYEQDVAAAAAVPPAATDEAAWQRRLADVGKAAGATVDTIQLWPTRTGYTVTGDAGSAAGATWEALVPRARALASNLKLPLGCGVEVGPGTDHSRYRIDVATGDTLAEDRTYADTSELSGNGLIPVGWYPNGEPVLIPVRQECTLCVSDRGGGKSNWLHSLTAGYVRCPDILVWHIDLAGAGLALPWARPYLQGRIAAPVVDWPAPDVDEALAMTETALEIIHARRVLYADLMADQNTDLVPCSWQLPQIRIIIDETAKAAGAAGYPLLRQRIVEIIQEGRGAAFGVDVSALRAVATILPTDALQLIGVRALFKVNDEAEIGRALGWHTGLKLGSVPHRGGGHIRITADDGIRRFRTERAALPDTIAGIAAACVSRRPALDGPSLDALSPELRAVYESRWDRLGSLLIPGSATGSPRPVSPARRAGSPGLGGSLADVVSRVDQAVSRAKRAFADDHLRAMPDAVADARFAELAAAWNMTGPAAGPGSTTDGPLPADSSDATLAVLRRFGAAGAAGTAVHAALAGAGVTVSLSRVYDYLNDRAVKVRHGVYVHPDLRSDQ